MRVLVLYCEEGEGHASAARALERELALETGAEVIAWDAFKGGLGRLIPFFSRDLYRVQVRTLRWTYGLEYLFFARFAPGRALARWGLALFGSRPLVRLIRSFDPELIVSTHPAVTNVVGRLRLRRRVAIPVVATITDFGVHRLWAHRGVDLHLVMHDRCGAAVERVAGRHSVRTVRAIVGSAFRSPADRGDARRALGLPATGAVVLISGGGWGVGDVIGAVEATLALPDVTVVCLSGRNELLEAALRRRFDAEPRVAVVAFTPQMSLLLAAADALVDSTVGVTCLEALTVGCGIVVYGVPPGHSRHNAKTMSSLGLARSARRPDELRAALTAVLTESSDQRPQLADAPTAASLIVAARPRELPRRSRRGVALAAAAVSSLVLAGWTFASPTTYPLIERTLDLKSLERVPTRSPEVAVVVEPGKTPIEVVARRLARRGIQASFAIEAPPTASLRRLLEAQGDDLVPQLTSTSPTKLLGESRSLGRLRRALGFGGSFYYLPPRRGFTLAEYLAASRIGGEPVQALELTAFQGAGVLTSLVPGAVIVVTADAAGDPAGAAALARRLSIRGLRAVSLSRLIASAPRARAKGADTARARAPAATRARPTRTPAARCGDDGHPSPTSTGASATGTNVVRANTSGATCETGRR